MEFTVLNGFWSDAGTFESLLRASVMVRDVYATPECTVSPDIVDVRGRTEDAKSRIEE